MRPAREIAARARELIASADPTRAVDLLQAAREGAPGDDELGYLHALALSRSGSLLPAAGILESLRGRLRPGDALCVETESLLGHIAKEEWHRLSASDERRIEAARRAHEAYARAYDASGDLFPGINAATMAWLAEDRAHARRLAGALLAACDAKMAERPDHWVEATRAEALLLLGRADDAAAAYARAREAAGPRSGDVASMRRQLSWMVASVPGARESLAALGSPRVIAFAGHMIDDALRAMPRFPAQLEPRVGVEIAQALDRLEPAAGYSSAACGSDLLFIEAMLRRRAEIHVVLPFRRADFIETSVRHGGEAWIERFDRALAAASSVTYAAPEAYLGDQCLFEYASELMQGLALLRAAQLEGRATMLAVLDDSQAMAPGGTLETALHWREAGREIEIVDIAALRGGRPQADAAPPSPRTASGALSGARRVRTMLFADVAGFSALEEEHAPVFFFHFLSIMAATIESGPERPLFANTWGDGLFAVFDRPGEAARFALRLRDAMSATDWRALGLPPLTVRMGMHSGPVFETHDPVLGRANFFGTHVNRAARIEPVAVPGSVYVSEQTAALLAASGGGDIACEYAGTLALAKNAGSGRLFRLRRGREIE